MPRPADARRLSILLALALSAFAFNTTENLPVGLLPLISADLHVSLPSAGHLVTAYGGTVALASLPLAQLTRGVPRRYLLGAVLAVLLSATLVTVAAKAYPLLLGARIATALAQALFWAVTAPVAVGLFSPAVRGRVIAVMSVGGALATVLGVPAGTWLGQRDGWRLPFLLISGLAAVALVVIATLLRTTRPEESHGAYAAAPHAGRFAVVLIATGGSVAGMFAGFTYVAQFLTGPGGFPAGAVGGLLFVFGLAGIGGVVVVGRLLDRYPRGTLALTVGGQALALLGLSLLSGQPGAVVGLLALLGATAAPVFTVTQARILHVAPGRTELGFAANSAAFNVGIAFGALLGGLVLPGYGAAGAFALGGVVSLATLAVVLGEPLLTRRPTAARITA